MAARKAKGAPTARPAQAGAASAKPARKPRPTRATSKPTRAPRPFTVFLDRDGVFNANPHLGIRFYRNLSWLPGAPAAFARLNQPHIRTSLATNQPWVGLLSSTPGMMHRLHRRFKAELEAHGGRLDNIEIAMAPPFIGHRRNKPRPGMLEDGAVALVRQGHTFDKSRAVMVGDKLKDAQAAAAFGIPAILLATTYDAAALEASARRKGVPYLAIAPDLDAAVDVILDLASRD